jgi:hypothetical protein
VFDDTVMLAQRFIEVQYTEYSKLPSLELVKAKTGVELKLLDAFDREWFMHEFEKHARYAMMENAILISLDLLHAGKRDQLIEQMQAARDVSLSGQQRDIWPKPKPQELHQATPYQRAGAWP